MQAPASAQPCSFIAVSLGPPFAAVLGFGRAAPIEPGFCIVVFAQCRVQGWWSGPRLPANPRRLLANLLSGTINCRRVVTAFLG